MSNRTFKKRNEAGEIIENLQTPAGEGCCVDSGQKQERVFKDQENPLPKMPSADFALPLTEWFNQEKRMLPWREDKDPYHIWVSEIMLQQTAIAVVKDYYRRFMDELPDIQHLSRCDDERLMKLWEGLGYYSRVRNMKKTACIIMEKGEKNLPANYKELLSLPGIGNYTAGAISSIAFGIRRPAVDGNVLRVLSRLAGSYADNMLPTTKKFYEEKLQSLMERNPSIHPGDLNEGLMELGEVICIPNGKPLCKKCPLQGVCISYKDNLTECLPVRIVKTKRKIEKKTVFIIEYDKKVAVRKRKNKGLLSGLYEFPNTEGHLKKKEALSYILSLIEGMEKSEEKGKQQIEKNKEVDENDPVITIERLSEAKHLFSHIEWQMTGYYVKLPCEADIPGALWADRTEVEKKYAIPGAFELYRQFWMNIPKN